MPNHPFGEWYSFYSEKYDEWHVGVPTGEGKYRLFPDGIPDIGPHDTDRREELCNLIVNAVNAYAEHEQNVFVPGAWICRECNFVLYRSILAADSGNVFTDTQETIEPCPNDGLQMFRQTWKERALEDEKDFANRLDDHTRTSEQLSKAKILLAEMCGYLDPQHRGQINDIKTTSQFHKMMREFLDSLEAKNA